MDLQSLSLPDWLPWWAVIALLVPVAFYLALFLLMPFSTFGLRARLRDLELRIDALHEEIRGLTLRLPERGLDFNDDPMPRQPPIPPVHREAGVREAAARDRAPRDPGGREPAPRGSFGDPVADRMLAYMRDKAQSDLQKAEPRSPRPRAEPRLSPARPEEPPRETDMPSGSVADGYPPEMPPPPRPPRVPNRFGRRAPDPDLDDSRIDWPR